MSDQPNTLEALTPEVLGKFFMERHEDDEWHDDIHMFIVPRYKTSGLSGDEWRLTIMVEIKRKGKLLYERGYHSFQDAAAHLPWLLRTYGEMDDVHFDSRLTDGLCMQPGCAEPAVVLYKKIGKGCGRCGHVEKYPPDSRMDYYRAFCGRHARRGDCGLDDADDMYQTIVDLRKESDEGRVLSDISVSGGANLAYEPVKKPGDPGYDKAAAEAREDVIHEEGIADLVEDDG